MHLKKRKSAICIYLNANPKLLSEIFHWKHAPTFYWLLIKSRILHWQSRFSLAHQYYSCRRWNLHFQAWIGSYRSFILDISKRTQDSCLSLLSRIVSGGILLLAYEELCSHLRELPLVSILKSNLFRKKM